VRSIVFFIVLVLGLTLSISVDAYRAPRRSAKQVAYAIGATRPATPKAQRLAWAKILIGIAKTHNFDALSGWAIIAHESHWRAGAVGSDGEDIGLAQVRYTASTVCKKDPKGEGCLAYRASLFDPATNMRRMAGAITSWRKLCRKKIGKSPQMSQWLQGYGGYSRPPRILCGHKRVQVKRKGRSRWVWRPTAVPKPVQDILAMRRSMIRRLNKQRIR
jgi:hypothetical protein